MKCEKINSLIMSFALVVKLQSTPPNVFPLAPCCRNKEDTDVAIGCLVKDFLPQPVEVTWSTKTVKILASKPSHIMMKSNNLYSLSSHLRVKPAEWETNTYKCTVKHSSSSFEDTKEVSAKVCKSMEPRDPAVNLILPTCEVAASFDLTCLLSNYMTNDFNVKWLVNGKEIASNISKFEALKANDNTFMGRSYYRVNKEEWDKGTLYTCHVSRQAKGSGSFDEMYNISKCSACLSGVSAPVVHLIRPSYQEILTGKASVACLVVGHDLKDTQIIWEIEGKIKPSTLENIVSHTNKSQSRWSKILVTLEEWKKPQRYYCKAIHPCFTDSKEELATRESTYELRSPSVTLLRPSMADSSMEGSLTLVCDVTGFYPPDISIQWKIDNTSLVDKTQYTNGPVTGSGRMYSTYSILRIGKNEGGGACNCEVYHVTLTIPKVETIQNVFVLQTPSPPKVTIQFVMEDEPNKALLCVVEVYRTKIISINWHVKGKERKCGATSTATLGNGRVHTTCSLSMTMEEWAEVHTYSCHVKYQNGSRLADTERVASSVGYQTAPPLPSHITKPSFEELFRYKMSNITCRIEIGGANITWEVNGKVQEKGVSMIPNSSNWTESTLSISLAQWRSTTEITCKPQYHSIQIPQQKISRTLNATGQMKTPVIYLFPPTTEEVSASEMLSLICLVTEFYPEDIFMAWENGTEEDLLADTKIKCNHLIQRCSLTSLLTVQRAEWLMGTIYTCAVGHISSDRTLKKSINLYTGKVDNEDSIRDSYDQEGFDLNELDETGSVWTTASTFIALFLLTLLYSSFVTFVKVK